MKILMMTNTYTPVVGGVEESIRAFTDQFKSKGHEVLIVTPEFENIPKHEEGIIRIPAIQKFNHSDFSVNLPIPGLLSKLMNDFKPDIVHSHHPFLLGDMALRLCGQYSIPLVFTYHTMFEDYLHYLPFQNERIKRFVIELSTGYANLTDQVIVPSQSVYDILRKRGVEVPMDIIPTGVDIKRFTTGNGVKIRKQFDISGNAFVVGHLGRLTPEKNLRFLSEAVAEFVKRDSNIHFLVVGRGPLDAEIKDIFKRHNISERLHLTGILKGQDVIDAYHAMDIFGFASHTETQGLVLTEAIAAGVPIVAVDAPGARETVKDGKNGRLIPEPIQKDFIEALSWCFNRSSEELKNLKDAARKNIENYSIEFCAEKALGVYRLIRLKQDILSDEKHGIWKNIMHRIKTEWEMAKNFVEASEAALYPTETDRESEDKAMCTLTKNRHQKSWIIKSKRWLSRNEWSARLLNLKQSKATEAHPGLVLIQIDGFSKTQLNRALQKGEMPFLQRLLKSQHYNQFPLYTGLPSSTPSVQGELFYGVKQIVPAFAFFDEKFNKVFRMYNREAVIEVERQLVQQQSVKEGEKSQGLLSGGSSYSNVYAGGARESHFCAVKIGWDMFWRGVNSSKIVLLCLTHLYDFVRITVLMVVETILAFIDFLYGVLTGEDFGKELKFISTRTFICILLRELVALGAKMDISRGLPVVHMNFLGYDEQAHRRGPSTKFAHRALRGIDNTIAEIYWQAAHSTRRNYDVWIYSDHGQEDSISYVMEYGKTVEQAVTEIYREFTGVTEAVHADPSLNREKRSAKNYDQQGVQSQRARYLGGRIMWWIISLIGISYEDEGMSKKMEEDSVVTTAIGPTGNIYLSREFNLQERDQFARKLVKEAKIPAVLAPDGPGKVCVWNENGKFDLSEHAEEILGENHPYLEEVTRDLIAICHHSRGGAFTFIGWRPGKKPITFPVENGAHAGPGTEETNAFAILPSDILSSLDEPVSLRTHNLREFALRLLGHRSQQESVSIAKPLSFQPSENSLKNRTLRIMTYNVHSCVGMDGKISPERIARVIGRHKPDIVALQELDLKRIRTGGMDQPHIIAKELEMIYYFHPNIRIEEECYGSAVLSRFPMKLVKAEKLPGLVHKRHLEPRGAIWCVVDLGDTQIQFINTHLGLRRKECLVQAQALCAEQWLDHPDCKEPVVLCGDFNAWPRSSVCNLIRQKLRDVQIEMEGHSPRATWFSHLPMGRIDHVFVSPNIGVVRVEVSKTDLDRKSSDHLPLIVDIRF